MAKRKHAPPPVSDINVTPMVDVMLVMLIIFMVITPMLQKGVSVDKVQAKNPIAMKDADKEDAILVSVTRNGDTYLGTTRMAPDQMPSKIKDMLTNKPEKIVFISADKRAKYERVVTVVDEIRNAGVEQLGLLTDDSQANAAAPAN
ncbi:ExbD/TolR family protein [Bryobacter aggregatus]|uniref:ExbD/TolR family protein n=1 Tax=Bryobacter aggregatus TaxID=360054 RepID=UPI0004E15B48|nr:biopolymer transporter ExbD [Bryobacter aggregatus]